MALRRRVCSERSSKRRRSLHSTTGNSLSVLSSKNYRNYNYQQKKLQLTKRMIFLLFVLKRKKNSFSFIQIVSIIIMSLIKNKSLYSFQLKFWAIETFLKFEIFWGGNDDNNTNLLCVKIQISSRRIFFFFWKNPSSRQSWISDTQLLLKDPPVKIFQRDAINSLQKKQ